MITNSTYFIIFNIFLLIIINIIKADSLSEKQKMIIDIEKSFHPILRVLDFVEMDSEELNSEYWELMAKNHILSKLKQKPINKKAKNLIMFLGDGMSIHTLTATRSFIKNEGTKLSFEKFPYFGLSKTYCVDSQVPDSACTATAYLTGVKANYGTIGVNSQVLRYECNKATNETTHTESIAKWAQNVNKATGFVTTSRVTHASPAGLYAHTANRDWENDEYVKKNKCDPKIDIDIAQQLIYGKVGKNLKVILGGGRGEFRDKNIKDEEGQSGWRTDGKDLINEWQNDKKEKEMLFMFQIKHNFYLLI